MVMAEEVKFLQGVMVVQPRSRGPICFTILREKCISCSSCKAEIKAADEEAKLLQYMWYLMIKLGKATKNLRPPLSTMITKEL